MTTGSRLPNRSAWRAAALLLALPMVLSPAWPAQVGRTALGQPFVAGGVSQEEREALHGQRADFSLWVITAAQGSGALLADVKVSIRAADGRTVFEGSLDGPWLFVDLPLGRYTVRAEHEGRAQERVTTIHRGDHHQLFFYFDTGDTLGDEPTAPIDRRAYDGVVPPSR